MFCAKIKEINPCATMCIIGGGNSRKLPVSVKGVNSFTCPMIMPPTLKKLMGHIAFGACVGACVGIVAKLYR